VGLGSSGAAASTITPTVAATELSDSGILVKGTAVLTVDGANTAGAGIEAVGSSTITVQSADGTTAKVVLKDVTLAAGTNANTDVAFTGGDTADVDVQAGTGYSALVLEYGGSFAITGAGVVKLGNAAVFSGVGTWTAGGSEETETITLGPVTDGNTAQILGSDLTATLAADAATANIKVEATGSAAKGLVVKKAILDISADGGITLKGDGTRTTTLTLFGTSSDDLGVLYLGSGGTGLTEGSTGFTITDGSDKEAVLTPGNGSNPCVVLNSTGADDGVLKSITPDGTASGVITSDAVADDAITITNAATVEATS
jgi:hypothetical protein